MKLSLFSPPDPHLSVLFNVDSSVGAGGQNSSSEDIMLVQFLLRKNGEIVPAGGPDGEAENQVMRQVPPTGNVDQKTIDGIIAFQSGMKRKMPSTTVDGRVSVARGYLYGGGYWTIVAMNSFIRHHAPDRWPRLQDFPDCPGMLKARFKAVL
jgi:hypothetical protein